MNNKNIIDNHIPCLIKSIGAGTMIGISGYTYLCCNNKYIGALLFCIGLITICTYNLNLYTGKVGYIIISHNKYDYLLKLIMIIICNAIGCWLISIAPLPDSILYSLQMSITNKDIATSFPKSLLCGVLMFIAVDTYKQRNSIVGIIFCVTAFIISGMEHSIANMYYFFLIPSIKYLVLIFIYIVGNGIGSIIASLILNTKYHNMDIE